MVSWPTIHLYYFIAFSYLCYFSYPRTLNFVHLVMKTFSLFSVPILACGGDDCKINLFIQQNGQVITAFCLLFRTFHSASSHMYLFFLFFFLSSLVVTVCLQITIAHNDLCSDNSFIF